MNKRGVIPKEIVALKYLTYLYEFPHSLCLIYDYYLNFYF